MSLQSFLFCARCRRTAPSDLDEVPKDVLDLVSVLDHGEALGVYEKERSRSAVSVALLRIVVRPVAGATCSSRLAAETLTSDFSYAPRTFDRPADQPQQTTDRSQSGRQPDPSTLASRRADLFRRVRERAEPHCLPIRGYVQLVLGSPPLRSPVGVAIHLFPSTRSGSYVWAADYKGAFRLKNGE